MRAANKRRFRGLLLAGVYALGALCIVASGGGGGGSGNDDVTPPSNTIPPVVADLANMFFFGSLDQPFDADRYDYTASVDYSFRFVQITPVTADPNATVTINGETVRPGFASSPIRQFAGVNNPILIIVISEDKKYTKTYRLVITVGPPSSITGLSGLSLSEGVLNPAFDPGVMNYSSSVEYPIDAVWITPTSVDLGSTIVITNEIAQSGLPSVPLLLAIGINSIVINVTAEDGITTKDYNIQFTRTFPSSNANLSNLSLSIGVIDPIFSSDVTEYRSNVGFIDTSLQVIATIDHPNASITVKGIDVMSGTANQSLLARVATWWRLRSLQKMALPAGPTVLSSSVNPPAISSNKHISRLRTQGAVVVLVTASHYLAIRWLLVPYGRVVMPPASMVMSLIIQRPALALFMCLPEMLAVTGHSKPI